MLQNVQPNWSEIDSSKDSYILNKPVIPDDLRDYLCFTALQSDSTVALNKMNSPVALNIEYSTDKETWTAYTWDGTAGTTVTLTSIGDKVWFRTVSEVTLANTDSIYYVFAMTGKIGASGNLMSLMYKDFENAYEAKAYQFYRLFDMCPIVTPPKVPATKLGEACYKYLFRQCSILESAPELPATTLADMCYQGMFVNCASLTVAPELPATTMVYRCYNSMLAYTGITDAPYLRATTLATECYRNIFNTCLNLKRIRTNQTSWANDAWLTGASATGVIECPSALDCSTRDTSHVPAGWTIVRTDAPQSDWSQTDATEASYILNKPNVEPKIDELNTFFGNLYKDHEPLTITMHDPSYSQGIRIYYQLTSVPAPHFDLQYSYDKQTWYDFEYTEAAGGVWSTTVAYIGNGYASDHVYIRGNNDTNYVDGGGGNICYFVFNMTDSSITNAVKLSGNLYSIFRKENYWNILDFNSLGGSNQYGCYSLFRNTDSGGKYVNNIIDAGDLIMPAIKLKNWMCSNMFRATSITRAPYLPATFLASSCYDRMFYSCPNLQEISVGFTKWKGTDSWVEGVGSTGVFKCPSALDTTQTGANAIPSGWTVETI